MNLVRPITRHDIKGPKLFPAIRDDYRNRVIAMKQHRRVLLGDRVEIVFDNRLILTLQIEETIRLENLTRDDQIDEEIALANQLMPTPDSLAATLFIPMPPGADARAILGQMAEDMIIEPLEDGVRFHWNVVANPTPLGRLIPLGLLLRGLFLRSASNLAKRTAWSGSHLAATHGA